VAVARDGEVLWEEASAGPTARIAFRHAHTLFSLASVTKPITATALMILAERGLSSLTAINDYLGLAKLTAHVGSGRRSHHTVCG